MRKIFVYIFFTFLISNSINAEIKYKEYKLNPDNYYDYLHGQGDGIGWSITFQEEIGPKFFCQPRDLALGPREYIDMLENQVKEFLSIGFTSNEVDEMYLGFILAFAHQIKYPCK